MKWAALVVAVLSLLTSFYALWQSKRAADATAELTKIEEKRSQREVKALSESMEARDRASLSAALDSGGNRLLIKNHGPAVAHNVACSVEDVVLSGQPKGGVTLQAGHTIVLGVHGSSRSDFFVCELAWETDLGIAAKTIQVQRR